MCLFINTGNTTGVIFYSINDKVPNDFAYTTGPTISCTDLGDNYDGDIELLSNNCVFVDKVQDMVVLASKLKRRMKIRQQIIDDNGCKKQAG